MRTLVTSRTRRRLITVLAAATLPLTAAACGGSDTETTATTSTVTMTTATPTTATETTDTTVTTAATDTTPVTGTDGQDTGSATGPEVTVYRLNDAATQVVATTAPGGEGAPLRAALVALAAEPPAGQLPALPPGTEIVGTDVRDGVAYINLSPAFLQGYPSGGGAAETAILAPLVFTATEAASVERVRITVDGQTPEPMGSQYDWTDDLTRADFPDLTISGG